MDTHNDHEMDFNGMSEEELLNFINSGDSATPQENNDSQPDNSIHSSVSDITPEPQQEDTHGRQDENVNSGNDPLDGKTIEELRAIARDRISHISRQGNEIGELRKKVKELTELKESYKKEDFSSYNKDDVETVRKIASDAVREYEIQKIANEQRRIEAIRDENRAAYESLSNRIEFKDLIEPVLNKEFEKDPNIIYRPGYIQKRSFEILAERAYAKSANGASLAEKKRNASTLGSSQPSQAKPNKNVSSMSASEYAEFMGIPVI